MKQSMIYMQTLANQAGLPLRKVEEIVDACIKAQDRFEQSIDPEEAMQFRGELIGLIHALKILGGNGNTILNAIGQKDEEQA